MKRTELPIPEKYFQGNGIDVGAGYNPLEDTLSIDQVVRGGMVDVNPSKAIWQADALNLPLKDNTCDYVFSSHFLEHAGDMLSVVLLEFDRVLKHGGYIIAIVPDKRFCLPKGDHFEFVAAPGNIFPEPHGLIPQELRGLLEVMSYKLLQFDALKNDFTFEVVAQK
jgi:predicted SAM-dependent methyltransferase